MRSSVRIRGCCVCHCARSEYGRSYTKQTARRRLATVQYSYPCYKPDDSTYTINRTILGTMNRPVESRFRYRWELVSERSPNSIKKLKRGTKSVRYAVCGSSGGLVTRINDICIAKCRSFNCNPVNRFESIKYI